MQEQLGSAIGFVLGLVIVLIFMVLSLHRKVDKLREIVFQLFSKK